MQERQKWFTDRIGKTVFHNKLYTNKINETGVKIKDEGHALYLFDTETDYKGKLKHFDTTQEVKQFNKETV